jgi:murein DD-endopeptidase MepM/ murein hydrolase activator NlpD
MKLRPKLPWVVGLAAFVTWGAWYGGQNACGPFPDWHSSPYVLPYPAGSSYYVNQSNCTNGGHRGTYKYSYDFVMPIGTTVTAARAGVVADVRMKFRDGQHGELESNWVKIRHPDGTFAHYGHLTEPGALVKLGDQVVAGQPIALSGNSGNTGGLPHLHFHVSPCIDVVRCGTLPVTFRNADANPDGLESKRNYVALPSDKNDP